MLIIQYFEAFLACLWPLMSHTGTAGDLQPIAAAVSGIYNSDYEVFATTQGVWIILPNASDINGLCDFDWSLFEDTLPEDIVFVVGNDTRDNRRLLFKGSASGTIEWGDTIGPGDSYEAIIEELEREVDEDTDIEGSNDDSGSSSAGENNSSDSDSSSSSDSDDGPYHFKLYLIDTGGKMITVYDHTNCTDHSF